jgi:pimeloyl-ACP methyl ester carboxylesterase
MASIELDGAGARFAYDEAGRGPAVVLVHAGLADRRMWEHQFRALSARYRVIRYDWRGYGESADAAGPVARHGDLLALMDALNVDRAALVGCSYGGAHVLDAALSAPGRVTALGLVCSWVSGYAWTPQAIELIQRRMSSVAIPPERRRRYAEGRAGAIDPADLAAMVEANVRLMVVGPDRTPDALDPEALALALEMCRGVFTRDWAGSPVAEVLLDPPALGRLSEVAAPTLVVQGLADLPAIQEVADLLTAGIAGARRVDFADTGHLPPVERPERFTEVLEKFLDDVL